MGPTHPEGSVGMDMHEPPRIRGNDFRRWRAVGDLTDVHNREASARICARSQVGRRIWILTTCWRAACADAKLGRLRLHDLRHTAASQAIMSGENLPLIGKLLGHRRHRTTAGYAHLADGHLVEAAEKVGNAIAAAKPDSREKADARITPNGTVLRISGLLHSLKSQQL